MSVIINPRDILLQAAGSRVLSMPLPPNIIVSNDSIPIDGTAPPAPIGFAVAATFTNIIVEHAKPTFTVGKGYGKTVIYGKAWVSGALPTFSTASRLGSFVGTVTAYPSSSNVRWHLWITWETKDGVESLPSGGINGLTATTAYNVDALVNAMTGTGNPFKVVSTPITLPDGTVVPAGTYTSDAFIHNGEITNAKIANLAVDNAKIANLAVNDAKISNLSVSKLDAGSLKVGSFISSDNYYAGVQGFHVDANGTAEFNNVVVRGEVHATSGTFDGTLGAGTATFDAIVSASATEFEIADFTVPNGGTGTYSFYMSHPGFVAAILHIYFVRNGDPQVPIFYQGTGGFNGVTQRNWAGHVLTDLESSLRGQLSQGYHTMQVAMSIAGVTGSHTIRVLLLRSYR